MAGSGDGRRAARGRRGGSLLPELLVTLTLAGVGAAAALSLLHHSLRMHARANLLARAAPHVVEMIRTPPGDSTGVRDRNGIRLRWERESGVLVIRLELPDGREPLGEWRVPDGSGVS